MANWRAITVADIKTQLSAREFTAVYQNGTEPGDTDPTASIITAVVDRVRGAIGTCRRNILGAAGTVPEVLVDATVSIIIWRLMARSGGQVIDGEANPRRDAYKDSMRLLESIAKCEGMLIPEPDSGAIASPLPEVPVVYDYFTTDDFNRAEQDGA